MLSPRRTGSCRVGALTLLSNPRSPLLCLSYHQCPSPRAGPGVLALRLSLSLSHAVRGSLPRLIVCLTVVDQLTKPRARAAYSCTAADEQSEPDRADTHNRCADELPRAYARSSCDSLQRPLTTQLRELPRHHILPPIPAICCCSRRPTSRRPALVWRPALIIAQSCAPAPMQTCRVRPVHFLTAVRSSFISLPQSACTPPQYHPLNLPRASPPTPPIIILSLNCPSASALPPFLTPHLPHRQHSSLPNLARSSPTAPINTPTIQRARALCPKSISSTQHPLC